DLADQSRIRHRRGVDRDLVGPTAQQTVDIGEASHSPAHRERDEDLFGAGADDVVDGLPVAAAGGDVEGGEIVGSGVAVALGEFDGVAGVLELGELHTLDHASAVDVETGEDSHSYHAVLLDAQAPVAIHPAGQTPR